MAGNRNKIKEKGYTSLRFFFTANGYYLRNKSKQKFLIIYTKRMRKINIERSCNQNSPARRRTFQHNCKDTI